MSGFRDISRDPLVPKSNRTLEDALDTVTSHDELRQTLINTLISQGQVVHLRDSEYNNHLIMGQPSVPPPVAAPASPAQETCMRVVYPAGNNRVELYGASEEELDQKEAAIRSLFRK